jgi:hypothetical protein
MRPRLRRFQSSSHSRCRSTDHSDAYPGGAGVSDSGVGFVWRSVEPASAAPVGSLSHRLAGGAALDSERDRPAHGVLLLPDFVCNSGGIVGTRLAQLGVGPRLVRELLVGEVGKMVARALEASEKEGVSAAALARRVAEERYAAGTGQAYAPSGIRAAIARRLSSRIPRSYRRRHAVAEFLRVARSRFPA